MIGVPSIGLEIDDLACSRSTIDPKFHRCDIEAQTATVLGDRPPSPSVTVRSVHCQIVGFPGSSFSGGLSRRALPLLLPIYRTGPDQGAGPAWACVSRYDAFECGTSTLAAAKRKLIIINLFCFS